MALLAALAGCGGHAASTGGADASSIGDIPDNQVFVPYSPAQGGYTIKVPEGWSQAAASGGVAFTDKLNTILLASTPAPAAPDKAAGDAELAKLAGTAGFASGDVTTVSRSAGTALLLTYRLDAPPDPVTGKVVNDDVERYEFFHAGQILIVTLSGPHGADNVDPWRIVTDSVAWTS
ncbi:MAG TPA: hypothetical protein VGP16_05575 [Asanoa sp.]|nr:hypothetical protein [Asanoa sp.]